jgi:magnesium transporter
MPRFIRKTSKKAGLSPGTLIHIAEKKVEEVKIYLMNYDQEQLFEKELKNIEESFPYKDSAQVSWINIDGLHDVDLIGKFGEAEEDKKNKGDRKH